MSCLLLGYVVLDLFQLGLSVILELVHLLLDTLALGFKLFLLGLGFANNRIDICYLLLDGFDFCDNLGAL